MTRRDSLTMPPAILLGAILLVGCVDGPTRTARTAARVEAEAATAAARDAYEPVSSLFQAARFSDGTSFFGIAAAARYEAPYVEHTISLSGVRYAFHTANAAAAFSAAAAAFDAYADVGASDRATAAARAARATARGLSQLAQAEVAIHSSQERSPFDFSRPSDNDAPDPMLAFRAAVDAFDVADSAEAFFTSAAVATRR